MYIPFRERFRAMPTGRRALGARLVKNAFWIAFGDIVNRILKAFFIVYVTRTLTVAEYGTFSFALNLVSTLFILSDLGITRVLQRRLSEADDARFTATSFISQCVLLGLAAAITAGAALFHEPAVARVALLLLFMMAGGVFKNFFLVFHTAKNRMDRVAAANIMETIIVVGAGFFALRFAPSASALALAYGAGAFVAALWTFGILPVRLRALARGFDRAAARTILAAAVPLALGGMAWGLANSTDGLFVGWFLGVEAAAFYNAAIKIFQLLGPIGGIVVGSSFPSLVATRLTPPLHEKLVSRLSEMLFIMTVPIAVGGLFVATPFITTLYGARYLPAVPVFVLILFNLIQTSMSYFLAQLIFVHDKQVQSLTYTSVGWIVNILLCLVLIPRYGLIGAVAANIVGQTIIFLSHMHFAYTKLHIRAVPRDVWKPFFAGGIMAGALFVVKAWTHSIFLSVPFGAAVYLVALIALRPGVLQDLKNLFRVPATSPASSFPG